jgi:hypothetical protein
VDIRIGIVQSMKEIEVELPEDAERDQVMKEVETALGSDSVLWLTDRKGRRVGIPASRSWAPPQASALSVSARRDPERLIVR